MAAEFIPLPTCYLNTEPDYIYNINIHYSPIPFKSVSVSSIQIITLNASIPICTLVHPLTRGKI